MRPSTCAALAPLAVAVLVCGCGDEDPQQDRVAPPSQASEVGEPTPSDDAPSGSIPKPDLAGVPSASVPLALSEYLNEVQLAVRDEVGDRVFGGALISNADSADITLTIFGTDASLLTEAVKELAFDEQDRIQVVATVYSVATLEEFSRTAQRRLDAAGIEAFVELRWGEDLVHVNLVTAGGEPDPVLERRAIETLGELPALVTFSPRPVSEPG